MDTLKRLELDRVLEAAVVLSWPDLILDGASALVHVEYYFDAAGSIGFLRIWLSKIRGFWYLVCSYSASNSSPGQPDIKFENGYTSKRLAETVDLVMHHQDEFVRPATKRPGLVQISVPSDQDQAAASILIKEAVDQVKSQNLKNKSTPDVAPTAA